MKLNHKKNLKNFTLSLVIAVVASGFGLGAEKTNAISISLPLLPPINIPLNEPTPQNSPTNSPNPESAAPSVMPNVLPPAQSPSSQFSPTPTPTQTTAEPTADRITINAQLGATGFLAVEPSLEQRFASLRPEDAAGVGQTDYGYKDLSPFATQVWETLGVSAFTLGALMLLLQNRVMKNSSRLIPVTA